MDFHGARKYDTLHAVLWTSCLHIRRPAATKKGSNNDEKKILSVKMGSATSFCKTKNVTGVLTMAAALVAVGPLAADELETVSYVGLTAGPASASECRHAYNRVALTVNLISGGDATITIPSLSAWNCGWLEISPNNKKENQ